MYWNFRILDRISSSEIIADGYVDRTPRNIFRNKELRKPKLLIDEIIIFDYSRCERRYNIDCPGWNIYSATIHIYLVIVDENIPSVVLVYPVQQKLAIKQVIEILYLAYFIAYGTENWSIHKTVYRYARDGRSKAEKLSLSLYSFQIFALNF